jgi:hypothetical protein
VCGFAAAAVFALIPVVGIPLSLVAGYYASVGGEYAAGAAYDYLRARVRDYRDPKLNPDAYRAHIDRNQYQANLFPEQPPLAGDTGSFTDPRTGITYKRDWLDIAMQRGFGLHKNPQGRFEECYRATGAPFDMLRDEPQYRADARALGVPRIFVPLMHPGGQVCYDPITGKVSPSSSFDMHSPSLTQWPLHVLADVLPSWRFGDDYAPYRMVRDPPAAGPSAPSSQPAR